MKKGSIYFFTEGVTYILRDKNKLRKWIADAILKENYSMGILNFIFTTDKNLHRTNMKYLNHDTYTDIITFDNSDDQNEISGDIFISLDRVRENAKTFEVSFHKELSRVMIHGILHLMGYNDNTAREKESMTAKEDYYLSLQAKFIQK